MKYNAVTFSVAAEFEKLMDPEFTVVAQPGLDGIPFADWAPDYLSPLDCFHPALCAHQGFALALWNNLNTPPATKSHTLDVKHLPPYACPTADSYLQ